MINLSGQHLFIAGGGRGIGRETARMAARAGAAVSINYLRDALSAEDLVEEIRAAGGRAIAVQADITQEGAVDRALQTAVAELGPLTDLVISAGVFEPSPIEQMTLAFWERTMASNMTGTFLAVRAAVPLLRERGHGGSIVIYASTAGQRGSDIYSATQPAKGHSCYSCGRWQRNWPPTESG